MKKKILLLYPNSTNDGVMPLAIGILSTIAKDLGCDVEYFETSFYQKEGSVPEERERTGEFKASDRIAVSGLDNETTYVVKYLLYDKDGKIVGVAYEITGQGYGGAIVLIMGVDNTGKILGVRVISHHETPGLGDNIEVSKSDWITKFKGLFFGKPPKSQWKVKKDGGYFDQFTGATITPRGVVKAIKRGLQMLMDNRANILGTKIKTSLNQITVFLRRYS